MTYGLLNQRQQPRLSVEDYMRLFGNQNDVIAPHQNRDGLAINPDAVGRPPDASYSNHTEDWNNIFKMRGVPGEPSFRGVIPEYRMPTSQGNESTAATLNNTFYPQASAQKIGVHKPDVNEIKKQIEQLNNAHMRGEITTNELNRNLRILEPQLGYDWMDTRGW